MPVYNAEAYLRQAIESILSQSFTDFEFIIVDDGSTDDSVEVIKSYKDPRIQLIQQTNQGCYPARNLAISQARGEFLANMDADDISLPDRFQKQIDYLQQHPQVGLVGTYTLGCDVKDTRRFRQPVHFSYDSANNIPHVIKTESTQTTSTFSCQTILFRKALVERLNGYDQRLCFSADVDFVARAAQISKIACLPEYLYVFRLVPSSISRAGAWIQREIIAIMAAANQRIINRRIGELPARFTESELRRLQELSEQRKSLPRISQRKKQAYYETHLATLLRVNHYFGEAFLHALKGFLRAPELIFQERKLLSNLVKSLLRLG
jgi:glycosyltransferase involved in cell wall biosynthesis